MTTEEFDSIWKVLEDSCTNKHDNGIIIRRISPDISHDIFLGCEKPANRRMFLIRIEKQNYTNFTKLPQFRGFDLSPVTFQDDRPDSLTIGFILNDPAFMDVFSTLCEDIYHTADKEKNQKQMIRNVIERLLIWNQFLDIFGYQGLSPECQRGLYGELRFLRDVLFSRIGIEKAIHAWKGPSMGNQDFQISGTGVEVKTSIAKQHQKIHVASEQQLDDTGLNVLYIYYLSLREVNESGETLPGVIDQIRKQITSANGPIHQFEIQLFNTGYIDKQRTKYETCGYFDRDIHIFLVKNQFPRIIENDLKNGVGDVHYSIDLSSCMPFEVSDKDFYQILEGM
ncbi:PD-(D/E)XK motif protein [uncultured Methanoregula sp.]|uniref:PD-(D/E)XK motif protein n=1 Tax=uncultured Methanoregula sp. TaxID=1005933 RepID=UPI002AAC4CFE|nr:PD-(D/E)XK motif protein [uncultured Methanoregula sp.]